MPSVSYLKAPEYEDGHAGYSDPLDEQRFLVDEINQIEQSPDWSSTAIVIAYDDSDGWYDHQMGPIIRQSADTADTLTGAGKCGNPNTAAAGFQNDRCGVGPRLPLLVISPWAKQNYVDNTFTEQASIPRFIEDNWGLSRIGNESADASAGTILNAFDFNQSYGHAPAVILNDSTGEITKVIPPGGSAGSSPTATGSSTTSTAAATSATSTTSSTTTGTTTTTGPGSTAGGSHSGSGHSGSGHGTIRVTLPRVVCTQRPNKHGLTFVCTTKGGSNVRTMIRVRLFRGRSLVGNAAAQVRDHKVRLTLGKKVRKGSYRARVTCRIGWRTRCPAP
jgi:phospholipase C